VSTEVAERERAVAGYSAVERDEETGKFNRLSDNVTDKRSQPSENRLEANVTSKRSQPSENSLEDNAASKLSEPSERTRAAVAKRERAINANPLGSNQYRKVDLEADVSGKTTSKQDTRAAVAKRERAAKARLCGGKATEEQIADRLSVTLSDKRSDQKQDTRAAVAKRERAVKGGLMGGVGRPKNSLSDNVTDKLEKQDTRAADACLDVLDLYTVTELMTEVREGVRLGGGGVWHQVAAKVLRERLARRSGPTLAEQMAGKSTEHLRALVNLGRQLEHEERDLYRAARAELARRQGVRP